MSTADESQTPQQPSEQPPEETITTECAFVCYIDQGGHWVVDPQFNKPITAMRVATINDVFVAGSTFVKDMQIQETVGILVARQQVAAAGMMSAMQQNKSGLHIPGRPSSGL